METTPQSRQQQIEARAAALAAVTPDPNQTMRNVFGEMDEWIFLLGPWRFLFDPIARRWYFLDPAHDQYVDTGYGAGEAVFELSEGGWFAPPPLRQKSLPASAIAAAGLQVRFCAKCGARVQAGWKFCAHCQAPVLGIESD